jgi:hypothetical protein
MTWKHRPLESRKHLQWNHYKKRTGIKPIEIVAMGEERIATANDAKSKQVLTTMMDYVFKHEYPGHAKKKSNHD